MTYNKATICLIRSGRIKEIFSLPKQWREGLNLQIEDQLNKKQQDGVCYSIPSV